MLTLKEMPGLSGFEGGFEDFVPVFFKMYPIDWTD